MRRIQTQGRSRKRRTRTKRAKKDRSEPRSRDSRIAPNQCHDQPHVAPTDGHGAIPTADEYWLAHVAGAIRLRGGDPAGRNAA